MGKALGFPRITVMSERPGRAVGAGEHGICLVVVDEPFVFGVPVQFAPQPHGDICQMAAGCGTMSDFGGADGLLARTDAVQEIALVVVGAVEADVGGLEFGSSDFGGIGIESADHVLVLGRTAAFYFQIAFFTVEDDFAFAGGAAYFGAVFIEKMEIDFCRGREKTGGWEFAFSPDFDGAGVVHAQRPLDNVQMVCAEVGDLSAGVVQQEAEFIMAALDVIRHLGSRSEPEIIVESFGDGHGFPGGFAEFVVGWDFDFNPVDFSEISVSDQFGCLEELGAGALLGTGLEDASRFLDDLAELSSFRDEKRQGLFQVDVLALSSCVDGDGSMPVVGGDDDDGVHAVPAVQVAEIMERFHVMSVSVVFVHEGFRLCQMRIVHIAECSDDAVVVFEERLQVVRSLVCGSNEAQSNLFCHGSSPLG